MRAGDQKSGRLAVAQAKIDAATEAFLKDGGTITRLDNKGSPVEHLSWKEEAERTKAAGLSYVSEHGRAVLSEKPKSDPAPAAAARQESLKKARETRSKANAARRAEFAPKIQVLAECGWTVGQMAEHFEIAPGTVRRIGRDHGIALNRDRGAMPVRQAVNE